MRVALAIAAAGIIFAAGYLYGLTSSCEDGEMWSWQAHQCVMICPAVGCT